MITFALITAFGIYIIFLRLGIHRVLRFGASADIAASIGLALIFAGTFSGLMVAAMAGVALSGMLYLTRWILPKPAPKPSFASRMRVWTRRA
jgi:hypothetical protein